MHKYSATVKEITALINGTDLSRRVHEITKAGHYNSSTLYQSIVDGINSHYLSQLESHSLAGKRDQYLMTTIDGELDYYENADFCYINEINYGKGFHYYGALLDDLIDRAIWFNALFRKPNSFSHQKEVKFAFIVQKITQETAEFKDAAAFFNEFTHSIQ